MLYSAFVKNKETKEYLFILNKEYRTMKDFAHDLHVNGYTIYKDHIAEAERFDFIQNNTNSESWHWKVKKWRRQNEQIQ